MLVLSLDTTSKAGSVAVVRDGTIVSELAGDPQRTHGERLPRDLIRVLDEAGVTPRQLDLLAVAAGPGSFTGLRVGIATIQGLATATGLRVVPVSILDALAHAAGPGMDPIGAWIDAQRGQVFATLFDPPGRTPLSPPSSVPPLDTLRAWEHLHSGAIRFIGDGAVRYAELLDEQLGARAVRLDPPGPLAGIIGTMAGANPDRAVLPHAIVPIYIRRPDAELARQQRAGRGSP